jgi:hypothetical protein
MTREGLDDEGMAARLRQDDLGCDRTTILRARNGRLPRRRLLDRIIAVTAGEVTANDFMQSEAAE